MEDIKAVQTRMYWWDEQGDEIPAITIHQGKGGDSAETIARKFAEQRSKDIKGRIELWVADNRPPIAIYKCGVDILYEERLSGGTTGSSSGRSR